MKVTQQNFLSAKEQLLKGGGDAAIAKQHQKGKMFARERLEYLFDEGTFVEKGLFVKHHCTNFGMTQKEIPADGVITGHGYVNGRLTYAFAQDFTAAGGSLGEMHAEKICALQEEALRMRAPIIGLNDSGGARIQEGISSLAGYSKIFYNSTKASGIIPQISVILGPCAGGAVYSPALMDFVFMVDNISQMFITGPKVVETVIGEKVSAEALGGAAVHNAKSGCAHFRAKAEKECLDQVKQLLSFLPQNFEEKVPSVPIKEMELRREQNMDYIIPENKKESYDMRKVIEGIADDQAFFEVQKEFAPNILVGFVRIAGRSVGVVASQPMVVAGCLDIDASDKAARFVRTCDSFNIPLLTLVDVPGYLPGTKQEYGGIIRHGAKLLYAYSEASVPKITVITRKAYGGAYIGMCSKNLGADVVLAWPDAEIAVLGAEGAADIIFAREIAASETPEQTRAKKIKDYEKMMLNPYAAAQNGFVDDVILPSQTRARVMEALCAYEKKASEILPKKHGIFPV